MNKVTISEAQANYLRELKLRADISAQTFNAALSALALASGDDGTVTYDLGAEPWVAVEPKAQAA